MREATKNSTFLLWLDEAGIHINSTIEHGGIYTRVSGGLCTSLTSPCAFSQHRCPNENEAEARTKAPIKIDVRKLLCRKLGLDKQRMIARLSTSYFSLAHLFSVTHRRRRHAMQFSK